MALVAVLLVATFYALRRPWVGVLIWTWVSIMNPHKLAFGFANNAPFAAIAAAVTFLAMVFTKDKIKVPWSPPVVVLLLFVLWMCLTTVFAMHGEASWIQLNKVLKIQLMTLVALAVLYERKHIELFVWVNILSIGFYGFKGGIFTITSGGGARVWGPPGGFIEGNNELAVALIMTIPLMYYLRVVATRVWVRQGLLVLMLLTVVAALGTQSRGALLAICAMGVVLWLRSQSKVLTGVMVAVVASGLLAFMPDSWSNRMGTIQTYETDGSAMGRINAWHMTYNLANDRFLGGGFAIYQPDLYAIYAPNPNLILGAHSIYFSVLGEHGWVGLGLFLLVWILALRTAARVRKEAKQRPETMWLFHLAGMCQVSIIGYAVGGAFLALSYFDLPYNILVVLLVSERWLKEKRWETETHGAFGSAAPAQRIQKPQGKAGWAGT
ncbi:putative O-glycosylation ligase, exosortase A system-associated [Chitinimonas sp. PSY-7]|uniref:putative O-glycosylation ligase, exosortase A system-associated n=1 Tax=Chitinimonas sp. PSY-7 TaxID=3459088 RepID=UPI00403FCE41